MSNITLHYSDSGATARCQNCDWTGPFDDTESIVDVEHRVTPGEIVPAGECPKCGSLAHLDPPPEWSPLAKLAQAEAELQAYHALHDLLSEIIEDADSAALTQGSERRARIVEKLTSIPR